jgi:hypothetical protein
MRSRVGIHRSRMYNNDTSGSALSRNTTNIHTVTTVFMSERSGMRDALPSPKVSPPWSLIIELHHPLQPRSPSGPGRFDASHRSVEAFVRQIERGGTIELPPGDLSAKLDLLKETDLRTWLCRCQVHGKLVPQSRPAIQGRDPLLSRVTIRTCICPDAVWTRWSGKGLYCRVLRAGPEGCWVLN